MNRLGRWIVIGCCALLFSHAALAKLPNPNPVPGGIALVKLGVDSQAEPKVMFGKKRIMVLKHEAQWFAVVGLPIDTKPGQTQIHVVFPLDKTIDFTVKPKRYQRQYIKIKNKRKVNPHREDFKRINAELKTIDKTLSHWSDKTPFDKAFIAPLRGRISSMFGLRRYYNGKPRAPHTGLDIAAPRGSEIKAPASGIVLKTGDFFYTGNTVFLDHGKGLISIYAHLEKILVKPGQQIPQGKVIGLVGSTGRATGPHLHLGIVINQARIDPLLIVPRRLITP